MGKAIIGITPDALIGYLCLDVFKVCRTQYNFVKDLIECVVEHDIFPGTKPEDEPLYAKPHYTQHYEEGKNVKIILDGVSIWFPGTGEYKFVSMADITAKGDSLC